MEEKKTRLPLTLKTLKSVTYLCIMGLGAIFTLLLMFSCGDDDNNNSPGYISVENVEGMYIVTISCQMQNGEEVHTKSTGNLTIKKQEEGIYSLDLICDEYGLNERIEGVSIKEYGEYLSVSNRNPDNETRKSLPLWYHTSFSIKSNYEIQLGGTFTGSRYGVWTEYYHFEGGRKISN